MDLLVRAAIVAAVVVAAFGISALLGRRPGRSPGTGGLAAGVVLVGGPACRLCLPARRALDAAGVAYRYMPAPDGLPGEWRVRALPTVLVVDGAGRVRGRRTGPAVISGAAEIARLAARVGVPDGGP